MKPIVFPIAYCHPPGKKKFERESNAKKKKGQRDSRGSVTPGDPCVSDKKKREWERERVIRYIVGSVQDLGFRVLDFGFWGLGLGFRVWAGHQVGDSESIHADA